MGSKWLVRRLAKVSGSEFCFSIFETRFTNHKKTEEEKR